MKDRELATFCKELAIMVRAGMTLEEAIEFIAQDSDDEYTRQVIKKIKKSLKESKSMDQALQRTQEFPKYMLRMIQIGQLSNRLGEVLEVLTQNYLREARLKENLKRAIHYPIYLGSVMCIVMIFLVVKVMPIFNEVILAWNGELTQPARHFMKLSRWIEYCTIGAFVIFVILSIVGVLLIKTERGRSVGGRMLGCTSIAEKINTAHFAWALGIMLKGGFSLEQSLQKSLSVVENKTVQQRVKRCIQKVGEKNSFENALVESRIFSRVITRLLISGFANGQLQDVVKQVGEESERNVQYMLENRVLAIETIAVGITSIIIGSILISTMLTVMGLVTSLV